MRSDDATDRTWFRTERVFHAGGHWYFSTREGFDMGPYGDRPAAVRALAGFVRDRVREAVHHVRSPGPARQRAGTGERTTLAQRVGIAFTLEPRAKDAIDHRRALTANRRG
jgi:hypothetical protein